MEEKDLENLSFEETLKFFQEEDAAFEKIMEHGEEEVTPTPAEENSTPPVEEKEEEDENSDTWKHKYEVLQGKLEKETPNKLKSDFDKKVARLTKENSEKDSQIAKLQGQLESLQSSVDKLLTSKKEEEPEKKDEEFEKFKGEFPETASVFEKMMQKLEERNAKLEKKLSELEGDAKSSKEIEAQNKVDRFYSDLGEQVPNWEELNNDPAFISWVKENDELDLLQQAARSLKVKATANFFKRYIKETTPEPKENLDRREEHLAPATKGTPPPSTKNDKKFYKEEEVRRFFRDKNIPGRLNMSKEKIDALDREYTDAVTEGRIY